MARRLHLERELYLQCVGLAVKSYHHPRSARSSLVDRFELSTNKLDKALSRKDFVESLHSWYKSYRQERGLYVDYESYSQLDNEKYFKDVDLDSEF